MPRLIVRLSDLWKSAFAASKLRNKLGTISAEHHQKRTRIVQGERRRITNIDNRTYLDTVEVIGSIPVAPISRHKTVQQVRLSFAKTREKLLRCISRLIVVFVFGPGPSFFFRLQCLNLATSSLSCSRDSRERNNVPIR